MASAVDRASAKYNQLKLLSDRAGSLDERRQLMSELKVNYHHI